MRTGEAGIKLVAVIGADDRPLRCLIATIALGRASVRDDVTQVVIDELRAAQFIVERSVTVNREKEFIRQLVSSVVDSNEADAIVLIGGAGVGPRDFTCEAVDDLADRRLEGFGEAYRRLLFEAGESYPKVVTARATACVYNGSVVLALPRQTAPILRRAVHELVVPTLPEAVRIATGKRPPQSNH
jgi:molybdenum cofactor biosynthesis protein B